MSFPSQTIFRFAPSPNGLLHLGHAYSALYTDHWAKALGGTFLLRIEDIDIARCRPEFVDAVFVDLQWLGLEWPEPVRVQSAHFDDYRAAADRLKSKGLLYPCFCTRAEIRAAGDGRTDPDGAPIYPGTCRHLSGGERLEKLEAGVPVQWRLDMGQALDRKKEFLIREAMPDPSCAVVERLAEPGRWGDVLIVRKDTPTSYHLSVVVDDAIQGITHVTRGMDLYASSDIHVVLQELMGLPSPVYTHHRLIVGEDAEKLSKSRGSESLAGLRALGITPEDIRARLGF
ncbi:tRNA glutamyl-Q(34) synthetase GluQRS [Pelagibacterium halotolerans]|uniref:Glutamyl-Q-tRNA synthetase n=1 Tax=Pelagibacterium halotolerans (strain DSM 22347 / JCM 15775 / CGMCC 1.7692 / B2) TaxID=1082931 RepID=G4RFI5_PELHB|nr:glutamyl-Q-tRNA synthetase [Pelagibacterium halotolerans B2]QJR20452.1 tRNA glutamyl-Q(34) synthetase GluQRS [Pelagibacterium halotolerans]SEA97658.1 glutamyl-Q tRNA(Asp) synthetase [Pelagibacterium halotolerans]